MSVANGQGDSEHQVTTEELDDVVGFLADWGVDSDDGDLTDLIPAPEPEPEREQQDARSVTGKLEARRVSVCLGLAPCSQSSFETVEAMARNVEWPERAIRWLGSKLPSAGCGFASKDMYTEFAKELQRTLQMLPGWIWFDGGGHPTSEPDPEYLTICCSVSSPKDESSQSLAQEMLVHLRSQLSCTSGGTDAIRGARVLLISEATKIPLISLSHGLSTFVVSESQSPDAVAFAAHLLDEAGMCVMMNAVTDAEIQALARLAVIRSAQVENALASTERNPHGKPIGSGDITFAEICSRGIQRWDMLLHPPGQPLAVRGKDANDQAMVDAGFAVLQRVASSGPWVAALQAALGLNANGYKWQASIICSRPVRSPVCLCANVRIIGLHEPFLPSFSS